MRVLGISGLYHDAAATLLEDGRIVAAAEEERFSRRKHDAHLPVLAARYCLEQSGIEIADIDHVIFYEKPFLKFERILASSAATFPRSRTMFIRAMQTWLEGKLWVKDDLLRALGYRGEILFGEHHLSHAASAYYPSPFDEAAVVTADGVGEWTTTTIGAARGLEIEIDREIRYPHSLGLLYSALTAYLGFEVNEGEYKVMGMAAYGKPRYVDQIQRLIATADDGGYHLNMRYLGYHGGLHSYTAALVELFGPPRDPDAALDDRYADIASSIQQVTEEAILGIARQARLATGCQDLCLAGGVALNVMANARVLREAGFRDIWVQPAAGDSGGSLGAATYLYHAVLGGTPRHRMDDAYLGPEFSDQEIAAFLESEGIACTSLPRDRIAPTTAGLLAEGNVIGWFQGRMEFGPRALGARSILADPTRDEMKEVVNTKIKHREQFRPFAPAVLAEASGEYFDFGTASQPQSPFMLLLAKVREGKQSAIPAVTHVDGSARVQTISRQHNPLYYDVIQEFGRITGVPVLLNTSFNVRGEPIVCTPREAFNSFSHTDMDYLVLGSALIPASSKRKLGPYPGSRQVHGDGVVL